MNAELVKFIAVLVAVILPLAFILWAIGRRFDEHDEEITELKKRINKLENKKDYDTQRD